MIYKLSQFMLRSFTGDFFKKNTFVCFRRNRSLKFSSFSLKFFHVDSFVSG